MILIILLSIFALVELKLTISSPEELILIIFATVELFNYLRSGRTVWLSPIR